MPKQLKSYDVVIIGAGLAGLQCAKILSLDGADVLLVDRKHDLAKGIHTTGIFVRKTFEDFDFPPGTLGRAIRNVTLYSPKLKPLDLCSEKDEFRVGKMGVLYETILSDCIANGVEFAAATRYVSADIVNDKALIKLEKGGIPFEVTAKVLVGGDGANSRVARDLGLDENEEWIIGYEEVYRSRAGHQEPRLHCFLDGKLAPGYLAWIADDGEDVHVGVGGYAADFDPRKALIEFRKKTADLAGLGNSLPVETRGGRIPVGGVLRRIANRHGLLIGDAAGAVSPLTAGGLDPCLRLSVFAANVIGKRLKTGDAGVMLRYSGELFRARFISRLWMRRLISIFKNQSLIEMGFRMLRTSLGKRFAKHVFFGRGSFPDIEPERSPADLSPSNDSVA
ncbi:MAG: NAD(P)/FAD-dependent oxidoreductase [Pyrinomonadaceae bacterium]